MASGPFPGFPILFFGEPMDLSQISGHPVPVSINGLIVNVRRGTLRQIAKLQEWINRQPMPPMPGPPGTSLEENVAAGAPEAVLRQRAEAELRARRAYLPPEVDSAAGVKMLMASPEGARLLVRAMLEKDQPEVDDATADELIEVMPYDDLECMTMVFFATDPLDWAKDTLPKVLAVQEAMRKLFPEQTGPTDSNSASDADTSDPSPSSSTPPST